MKSFWWQIQRVVLVLLVGAIAGGLTGCGDDEAPRNAVRLTALTLSGSSDTVAVGRTIELSIMSATAMVGSEELSLGGLSEEALTAHLSDADITEAQFNDLLDAVATLEWSSSDESATVIGDGASAIVLAKSAGVADITVALPLPDDVAEDEEAVRDSIAITVGRSEVDIVASLPGDGNLTLDTAARITVTTRDADGEEVADVSDDAEFSVTEGELVVAIIKGSLISAIGVGEATVHVTYGDDFEYDVEITVVPVDAVELELDVAQVAVGGTGQLTATVVLPNGTTQDITEFVSFSSSAVEVATVSSGGEVAGVSAGEVTITASIGGEQYELTIEVGSAVSEVVLSTLEETLIVGGSVSLRATAMINGEAVDVTDMATWVSSATGVAAVSASGEVFAQSSGQADVVATYEAVASVPALVTVEDVSIDTISVSGPASAPAGVPVAFTAIATYNNGEQMDITEMATWSSGSRAVAVALGDGVVTGVSAGGSTVVTASLGGASDEASFTVSDAELEAIVVSASATTTNLGVTVQLMAEGQYSDDTQQDLTTVVTWVSGSQAVATVSAEGLLTPLGAGGVEVTASLSAIEDSISIAVLDAQLMALVASPSSVTVAAGSVANLVIVGEYSDGSSLNVTSSLIYTANEPSRATVSGGVVAGVSAGTTSILVQGEDGVQLTVPVSVTSGEVESLALSPRDESVPVGTSTQLTALAIYSDDRASQVDVTTQPALTWSSSNPNVVVSQAGLVSVDQAATGSATVTATWSNGVSASAFITVNPAIVTEITVQPVGNTSTVPVDFTLNYVAIATFSDGSTADVSSTANWTSSAPAIATVGETSGVAVVTGKSGGTASIQAAQAGVVGSAAVTVRDVGLLSISVAPSKVQVPKGQTRRFTATGVFEDGSSIDATSLVEWAVAQPAGCIGNCPAIATNRWVTISNQPGSEGLAAANQITVHNDGALEILYATITATYATASDNVVSSPVQMAVTSDKIRDIAISVVDDAGNPASVLPIGESVNLRAVCTYDDGQVVADCENTISFQGTANNIAVIDNSAKTLTGLVEGGTVISPIIPGNATATVTNNTKAIQVVDCAFDGITVNLGNFADGVLPLGSSARAVAVLHDEEALCPDIALASGVTWTSSRSSAAAVALNGVVTASATPVPPVSEWETISGSPGLLITLTAVYMGSTGNSFSDTETFTLRDACINALTASPATSVRMPIPQGSHPDFTQDTRVTGSFSVAGLAPIVLTDVTAGLTHSILDSEGEPVSGNVDPFTDLSLAASTGVFTTDGAENEGTVAVRVEAAPNVTFAVGSETYRFCRTVAPAEFSVTTVDSPVSSISVLSPGNRRTIGKAEEIQLIARANFVDDSITPWPVSTVALWDSNSAAVAVGASGQVTGVTDGQAIISATYAGQSGELAMTVSGRALEELHVAIANSFENCDDYTTSTTIGPVGALLGDESAPFAAGIKLPLVVVGLYSDGTYLVLTNATLSLSGTGATLGGTTVTTTGAGTFTVSASVSSPVGTVNSGTNSLVLEVANRPLVSVEIYDSSDDAVVNATLPAGTTAQYRAEGIYGPVGSEEGDSACVVTDAVTWSVNAGAPATVSAAGLLDLSDSSAAGNTIDLSAQLGGEVDVVNITVAETCLASLAIQQSTVSLLEDGSSATVSAILTLANNTILSSTGATLLWAIGTDGDEVLFGSSPAAPSANCGAIAGQLDGSLNWSCATTAGLDAALSGADVATNLKLRAFYIEDESQPVVVCDGGIIGSSATAPTLVSVSADIESVVLDCGDPGVAETLPNFGGPSFGAFDSDAAYPDLPVGVRGYCSVMVNYTSGAPANVTAAASFGVGATGSVIDLLAVQDFDDGEAMTPFKPFAVSAASPTVQSLKATYGGVVSNTVSFQAVSAPLTVAIIDAALEPVTGVVALPMFQSMGLPVTFHAQATTGASTYDVTKIVSWSSQNTAEVEVVGGVATANDDDCSETLTEIVADHSLLAPAADPSISVRPDCASCVDGEVRITRDDTEINSLSIGIGEVVTLGAECTLDDAASTVVDVTSIAAWSDNSARFNGPGGVVTAIGPVGSGTLTAVVDGSTTGSIPVSVVAPCVEEVVIVEVAQGLIAGGSLPKEVPVQFKLEGRLSGSTAFTEEIELGMAQAGAYLVSGTAALVEVSDFGTPPAFPGRLNCAGLDLSGEFAFSAVAQNATALVVTSDASGPLPSGVERQFKAMATYLSGVFNVATLANWTTPEPSILENVVGGDGRALGGTLGTTSLQAQYTSPGAGSTSVVDYAVVTVTSGVIVSYELEIFDGAIDDIGGDTQCELIDRDFIGPDDFYGTAATMPVGGYTSRVRVVGVYSDERRAIVTSGFTLSTELAGGGSPQTAVAADGTITTGTAAESLVITVSATGFDDAAVTLATVSGALVSVTPLNARGVDAVQQMAVGQNARLYVAGSFSSGEFCVSDDAAWSTASSPIVSLAADGSVEALAEGDVSRSLSLGGETVFQNVSVSGDAISSIVISPSVVSAVASGETIQFQAFATLADGAIVDVTEDLGRVKWLVDGDGLLSSSEATSAGYAALADTCAGAGCTGGSVPGGVAVDASGSLDVPSLGTPYVGDFFYVVVLVTSTTDGPADNAGTLDLKESVVKAVAKVTVVQ